jgi:hypothetical protein
MDDLYKLSVVVPSLYEDVLSDSGACVDDSSCARCYFWRRGISVSVGIGLMVMMMLFLHAECVLIRCSDYEKPGENYCAAGCGDGDCAVEIHDGRFCGGSGIIEERDVMGWEFWPLVVGMQEGRRLFEEWVCWCG